jgi:hypothetical protein
MDGCSLKDAFPDGAFASEDCYNRGSGDESRRQEKKKARRCRDPSLQVLEPDRQSVRRLDPVFAMNKETGLKEHSPATAQYPYEPFVGETGSMTDLDVIRKNVTSPNKLQQGSASSASASATSASASASSLSSYFGADPTDTVSPVQKEGFMSAPYVNVIGEDSTYRLLPDFAQSFGAQNNGVYEGSSPTRKETAYLTPTQMSPSDVLPVPNIDNFWKTKHVTGGQSSYFASLRAPGGMPSGMPSIPGDDTHSEGGTTQKRDVLEKLDRIFARLDDMETKKGENANTEVLMFIMTGLGVIFLMDVSCRVAMNFRK